MKRTVLPLLLAAALFAVPSLSAQGLTESSENTATETEASVAGNAQLVIGPVLWIQVTNLDVRFGGVSLADYDAGWIEAERASVVTQKANVRHSIKITAAAATMDAADSSNPGLVGSTARTDKPASDLQVRSGSASWNGLSTTGITVVQDEAPGDHHAGAPGTEVGYRMLLDYGTDTPGTYDLEFTYTILAS